MLENMFQDLTREDGSSHRMNIETGWLQKQLKKMHKTELLTQLYLRPTVHTGTIFYETH